VSRELSFPPDMEDHGVGVNVTLTDGGLEEHWSTWQVGNSVVLPPDHDLGLGFLGQ